MTGRDLRHRRRKAEIAGDVVSRRAGISRSRLSAIERGNVALSKDEARRLLTAIEQVSAARKRIHRFATSLGFRELS